MDLCTMTQNELIDELISHTEEMKAKAREHGNLSPELLDRRQKPEGWNCLECYEHMNRYGETYLGYFEEALLKSPIRNGSKKYKSGLMGGWSARSMEPQDVGVKSPMKTFRSMDPKGEDLEVLVIDRFIKQQEAVLQILEQAKKKDLDKVKCRTTIKILKFKFSDALLFFTNHNRRHILQVERILSQ